MTKIDRRQALKFGIAGAAGLAVVSVLKEAAAAPPAPNSRTLMLPLPPLELAAGATVFWSTEPLQETFAPHCLLLTASTTAPKADQGIVSTTPIAMAAIVLRRMTVGEEDQLVGLLPSALSELPLLPRHRPDNIVLTIDLRGEAIRLKLNHPLVLELHNPTDQVWHLRGALFGNKPI